MRRAMCKKINTIKPSNLLIDMSKKDSMHIDSKEVKEPLCLTLTFPEEIGFENFDCSTPSINITDSKHNTPPLFSLGHKTPKSAPELPLRGENPLF